VTRFSNGWVSLFCWLLMVLASAGAWEPRYWVWNRTQSLSQVEVKTLKTQGVKKVYWNVASLRAEQGRWVSADPLRISSSMEGTPMIVPVFRLVPGKENALTPDAAKDLAPQMVATAKALQADEVQIDFDCPDRLLASYAGFLRACRAGVSPIHLSATALGAWSRPAVLTDLQSSVEALYPMFYDLKADEPGEVKLGSFVPLLDPATVAQQLTAWSACKVPWYAGLPGFARVTIFNEQGQGRGHLRHWEWDSLAFNPQLLNAGQPAPSLFLLKTASSTIVEDTPLAKDEVAACRWPRAEDLVTAVGQAKEAGAGGVAIFRLPEGGASGGWSLTQWGGILKGKIEPPAFAVQLGAQGLQLTNTSSSDLPPRLSGPGGPQDRGWQLEIQGDGPVFREASPGEFAAVYGHVHPDAPQPERVPVPRAERLTFWFSSLPAGGLRASGLLQLAPGVKSSSLRWRIPGVAKNGEWQPVP
jgi:hypothetical protein